MANKTNKEVTAEELTMEETMEVLQAQLAEMTDAKEIAEAKLESIKEDNAKAAVVVEVKETPTLENITYGNEKQEAHSVFVAEAFGVKVETNY